MTTKAAERLYEAQHQYVWGDRGWAVYNPEGKPEESLPVIYGFNNGGNHGFMHACLIAEDGTDIGDHCCSSEVYMPHDLGVLNGSRPDRHETFRKHYPNGYRMEFVGYGAVQGHEKLMKAIRIFKENAEKQNENV